MKAVVLHEYGGPEKLKVEEFPDPQVSGDTVLIATAAASVNPIDWKVRSGVRQKDFPLALPAVLGRDVSGVVRAVGTEVRSFKPGDRVAAYSWHTYAELVAVSESEATHVPDGVDLIDASAIPLVCLTGDQLVRGATGVQKGWTVVVSGALGSVGRCAVHTAKKIGAQVIAGVRKNQLEEAKTLGVAGVVALDDDAELAKLGFVDAVADTVGHEVAVKLLGKVKPGGRFGYSSVLPEGEASLHPTITVQRVFAKSDPSKVREFLDDVRDGKFVLPISRHMPMSETAEAHRILEKGGGGKIVLLALDPQD